MIKRLFDFFILVAIIMIAIPVWMFGMLVFIPAGLFDLITGKEYGFNLLNNIYNIVDKLCDKIDNIK